MTRTLPIAIGALLVLILVLFTTTYTVAFHELAVKTRFGKPAGIEREAGLHFKLPFFVDQVTKIDTRLQLVESAQDTVLTRDQQQVVVQVFLFWKIDEESALKFFTAYGNAETANRDLEQRLQGSLRAVGGFAFNDLVGPGSKLPAAEDAILADLKNGSLTGIKPMQVGISQVLLPPKTTASVLSRMAEVQNTLAREEETRGTAASQTIKSNATAKADTIKRFTELWASRTEAQGDVEAAQYYEKMSKYRDLAIFLSWLDTVKAGLGGATTIVVDTQHEPFQVMDINAPTDAKGIPLAPKSTAPAARPVTGGQ